MDAAVLMDVNGKVTFWNNRAKAIFGWKSEEIIGKKIWIL